MSESNIIGQGQLLVLFSKIRNLIKSLESSKKFPICNKFTKILALVIFMDAIPFYLLLNTLPLFCRTQKSFIFISYFAFTCVLHISACT